jgi:hypothetical protein
MEKPGFLEISETRFHHLGKPRIEQQNPKKPGFQRSKSTRNNLILQDKLG